MKELIKDVSKLINEEGKRSMVEHPFFNSTHEGYAIVKEEIEEAEVENEIVNVSLTKLWDEIKNNGSNERISSICEVMKSHAMLNAAESIQVAAMCQKFIESKLGVSE